jgi:hypothetical protein
VKNHISCAPTTHRRTKRWDATLRAESKHHNGRKSKRDPRRRKKEGKP